MYSSMLHTIVTLNGLEIQQHKIDVNIRIVGNFQDVDSDRS